jgi:hypothetical protein
MQQQLVTSILTNGGSMDKMDADSVKAETVPTNLFSGNLQGCTFNFHVSK